MLLHGGRYENYCYRGHVTHIICTNLPDTKLKQMAHERWVSCKHSCALESLPGWCKPDLWPPSELRCSVTVALMLCRDPIPTVWPEWVVESLAAGRLLPVGLGANARRLCIIFCYLRKESTQREHYVTRSK